jgi:hypothetical protein
VSYFAAAAAAAAATMQPRAVRRDRATWLFICLSTAALGINKQLDLQSYITSFGREMARADGWYPERRSVQAASVYIIGLCGAALLAALLWRVRASASAVKVALFGLIVLGVFVMIRAVSIHHVDRLMRVELAGTRWTAILELGGATLILAASLAYSRRNKAETGRNRREQGKTG